jgi:N-acetyl-gamma-glutamyl-phosphate reductase
MVKSLNIAIAGATGYVGLELVKILSNHSKVNITYLIANKSAGKKINLFNRQLKKKLPKISKLKDINWLNIDLIFSALPNGEAHKIAKIKPKNIILIDLSADFRLDKISDYKKWYGLNHSCEKLIKDSHYSITEFSRDVIKNKNIISCPGCYPTSIQLPIIPLIEKKMINTKNIIVDSKSGYSGAGKNIKKKFTHKNLFNSVTAYGVGKHRHLVEINQQFTKVNKNKIQILFTPHLIPMFRGILSTIYLNYKNGLSAKKIYNFLKHYHKNNIFVKLDKFNKPIGTGDVMNTNLCNISVCEVKKKNCIIIFSAIDNLMKGAAGQAVQNMNVIYGFKEGEGLK